MGNGGASQPRFDPITPLELACGAGAGGECPKALLLLPPMLNGPSTRESASRSAGDGAKARRLLKNVPPPASADKGAATTDGAAYGTLGDASRADASLSFENPEVVRVRVVGRPEGRAAPLPGLNTLAPGLRPERDMTEFCTGGLIDEMLTAAGMLRAGGERNGWGCW